MPTDKVTIITSVFNAGDMLKPFLYNMDEQTVRHKCMHVLVCCNPEWGDDEDTCYEMEEKFPSQYKFFYLEKDPGIYGAWNYAIEQSYSEYITNANVDDRLHPECIEKHINYLDEHQDIDLAYCKNLCTFKPNDEIFTRETRNVYPTSKFKPKLMLRGNLPHNHPVWRRSLHDRFGMFDTNLKSAADWEMWLRCVAGGSKFALIPEYLGLYYWNPSGVSTSRKNQQWKLVEENNVRRKYQNLIR